MARPSDPQRAMTAVQMQSQRFDGGSLRIETEAAFYHEP
jgi:hypothetical protein